MAKPKVVLAYSGGLDTSVILKWLDNKGFEVICFVGNVGQNENFDIIEQKAFDTGATKVYVEDLREEFVSDYIYPALRGNALYEGRYLLGTSLARPLLAKKQIEIAAKENAEYVSHGATGKGNDQVRFELTFAALNPNIRVISPWKDPEFLGQFKGRPDLLKYAEDHNIEVKASKEKSYSEDENLMVNFEGRDVLYESADLGEIVLAYAVTVHKSQGSEFPCVIIPLHTTHYPLLQRNLIYTAVTRGKSLVILVGSKKAINIAINNNRVVKRYTMLKERLQSGLNTLH